MNNFVSQPKAENMGQPGIYLLGLWLFAFYGTHMEVPTVKSLFSRPDEVGLGTLTVGIAAFADCFAVCCFLSGCSRISSGQEEAG